MWLEGDGRGKGGLDLRAPGSRCAEGPAWLEPTERRSVATQGIGAEPQQRGLHPSTQLPEPDDHSCAVEALTLYPSPFLSP